MEDRFNLKETTARKRLGEMKKFYWLLITGIFASAFMLFMAWLISVGDHQYAEVPTTIFLSTPFVFGVVIIIHYLKVFNRGPFSMKSWEEKKIQKFLEENKNTGKWN